MPVNAELILFVSIDVVGATAYKNNPHEERKDEHPWLKFFKDLYGDFDRELRSEIYNIPDWNPNADQIPELWKLLGDELVYTVKLSDGKHAKHIIRAFRSSITNYIEIIRRQDLPLSLKATAWTAGFPVVNARIETEPTTHTIRELVDYIGPSIDAGFRLCKYASDGKFIISVELALILTRVILDPDFDYFLDGTEPLKGVMRGKPYPIIWISMASEENRLYRSVMERKPVNASNLREYLQEYVAAVKDPLMICEPYILGDNDVSDPLLSKIPTRHTELLHNIRVREASLYTENPGPARDEGGTRNAEINPKTKSAET